MTEDRIRRFATYCTTLYYPIYMLYKLKDDPRFARRRYCAYDVLCANAIRVSSEDYVLSNWGVLAHDFSIPHMVETEIERRNSSKNNSVSVGDVFVVLRANDQFLYYVDPVGLKALNVF